jgi:hypothetical protein
MFFHRVERNIERKIIAKNYERKLFLSYRGNILLLLCYPPFLVLRFAFLRKKGGLLHLGVKNPPKTAINLTLIAIK